MLLRVSAPTRSEYGEGLSYFSTDPRACKNCHVMNDQYASWSRGPHHAVARCVDCHLPHEFVPKYLAKADNGYRHSKGFTFMDFHEPIMIKPRNAADPAGELPALPRRFRARHRARQHDARRRGASACIAIAASATARDPEPRTTHDRLAPHDRAAHGRHARCDRRRLSPLLVFLVTGLLTSIFERKQEARNPYVRLVEVNEETTDPAAWGMNWAREYDDYKRTAEVDARRGSAGRRALPARRSNAIPWLTRMFAGYAFAIDYRDRRGHAYMLQDQEQTRRVTERPQPGSCLHCHASVIPTYRRLGGGDVFKGFEALGKLLVRRGARRGRQDRLVEPGRRAARRRRSSTSTARIR